MATKKFKFKVYYDPKNNKLEGIPVVDTNRNQVGSAIVVADAEGKLPKHNNPLLLECEADLIIVIPKPKKKGEITLRK